MDKVVNVLHTHVSIYLLQWCRRFSAFTVCPLFCLHLLQVVEGGEEVATRMTAVIGILGVGGATLAVIATGTGTMIEGLVVGQKVPLVAIRPKMVVTVEATVATLVVAMATTTVTAMDRVILVLQQIRWVSLVTKASRAPLNLGVCRGLLRMA